MAALRQFLNTKTGNGIIGVDMNNIVLKPGTLHL